MAPSANRKRTILGLVLAAALIGAAVALPAWAAPSKKIYSAAISPTGAGAGASAQPYTLFITNSSTSSQSLGSANIDVPTGFTVSSGSVTVSSAPTGESWSASLSGSTIQLRSGSTPTNSLTPGQTVSIGFSAQDPCLVGTYSWTTHVKQSNDFLGTNNDFSLAAGASYPAVAIGAGSAATIAFASPGQPTDTQKTLPINGTNGVKVTVKDSCGNPVPNASVGMAIGVNPPGTAGNPFVPAILSGTTPNTTNSSGIATFSDLSIDQSSSGYSLVATLVGTTTSVESQLFDITTTSVNCTGATCSATATSGTSSLTLDTSGGSGTLSLTYESHTACGSGDVPSPVGGTITIDPPPGSISPVIATFDDTISPQLQDSYPVCKAVESGGVTTKTDLQFCSDTHNVLPCIKEQTITFHGSQPPTLHTVVWMTATDPHLTH